MDIRVIFQGMINKILIIFSSTCNAKQILFGDGRWGHLKMIFKCLVHFSIIFQKNNKKIINKIEHIRKKIKTIWSRLGGCKIYIACNWTWNTINTSFIFLKIKCKLNLIQKFHFLLVLFQLLWSLSQSETT